MGFEVVLLAFILFVVCLNIYRQNKINDRYYRRILELEQDLQRHKTPPEAHKCALTNKNISDYQIHLTNDLNALESDLNKFFACLQAISGKTR